MRLPFLHADSFYLLEFSPQTEQSTGVKMTTYFPLGDGLPGGGVTSPPVDVQWREMNNGRLSPQFVFCMKNIITLVSSVCHGRRLPPLLGSAFHESCVEVPSSP